MSENLYWLPVVAVWSAVLGRTLRSSLGQMREKSCCEWLIMSALSTNVESHQRDIYCMQNSPVCALLKKREKKRWAKKIEVKVVWMNGSLGMKMKTNKWATEIPQALLIGFHSVSMFLFVWEDA